MFVPSMVRERETSDERPDGGLGTGARALNYGASALLTGVIMVGAIASIIALAWVLGRLNRMHEHLREARGADSTGPPLLEVVLVVTAAIALVGFAIWFFVLAGPGPQLAPRT